MATRRTHRKDFSGQSEYTGEFRRNTISAKDAGAPLDASEKLRLLYLTGTTEVTAEPDRRAWLGFAPTPDSEIDFED